jgi:2-amino-4-hydroxy-6-hydroxymethyldihydropteridine diphosphokinase
MNPAWIGLGSNLGKPCVALRRGMALLDGLDSTQVRAVSPAYWTPPWGVSDQPDYLNAVVKLATELSPHALLRALLDIEHALGRRRDGQRWAPRELDLDLLVYDGVIMDTPDLTLPHPRLHERAFVLVPLNDLSPNLMVPGRGRVADLLENLTPDERAGVRLADLPAKASWLSDLREDA